MPVLPVALLPQVPMGKEGRRKEGESTEMSQPASSL